MKKMIFPFLLLPIMAYSKSYLVSPVELPTTYIQNLDPYPCDEQCMQEYLRHGKIFSFLSHANMPLENEKFEAIRIKNVALLNLGEITPIVSAVAVVQVVADEEIKNEEVATPTEITTNIPVINEVIQSGAKVKIAMLLPHNKIGKYAASTTNAALAYLIAKNHAFELKSYKIESESTENIQKALEQIQQDGFEYIIAPLTQDGVQAVSVINPNVKIYFPTINKKDSNTQSTFLYFGGIDYEAQSNLLISEAVSPLVIFYDQSPIGGKLALHEEEQFKYKELPSKRVIKYSIPAKTTNLSEYLEQKGNIRNGSFFINTPIVKTGMIMSQITLFDVSATNILSTQINYDPLLLSMTQYEDRKKMIVANSITEDNHALIETNSLLSNDIVYDWINYTTTVGIDYFFSTITQKERVYKVTMENNQINYAIELLKPTKFRFVKHGSGLEE